MNTVQIYTPDRDISIAIEGKQIEIYWLRNLAIAIRRGDRQVCDRWDELNLEPEYDKRHNNVDR